jgi:FkbM family methyltransferase
MNPPTKVAEAAVAFYRFWHGSMRMPGAGWLLRRLASRMSGLQAYPLPVPGVGRIPLDFRDVSAYGWVNTLLGEGHQEDGIAAFLTRHFTAGGVFWDVGANMGQVTAALFPRFPEATYFAFEPNPDLAARLKSFFREHRNVSVHEVALSDTQGTATLHLASSESCRASLSTEHIQPEGSFQVPLCSGDEFLRRTPKSRPTLIKIDVEGHEPAVLKGCQGIIRELRPTIVFEHLFLSDADLSRLVPDGYLLRFLHDADGRVLEGLDRTVSHNAVLLPKG